MDGTARRLVKQAIDEGVRERLRLEDMGLDSGAGRELTIGGESRDPQAAADGGNDGFLEGWLDWLDATNEDRTLRPSIAD